MHKPMKNAVGSALADGWKRAIGSALADGWKRAITFSIRACSPAFY
jgi:hypothetical protein